ncbi:MAG: SDR family oxidoreductase [Thermoanaerobaculum sp.]|nr:SDR family oxidoreductase [Thermoanaerobaculum sp.]
MRIRNLGALVTGASRGIGRALAVELGRRGCRVALVARDPSGLDGVVQEVLQVGGEARAFPADVRDSEAMQEVAGKASSWLGRWQVVVANAGVGYHGPVLTTPAAQSEAVLGVNFLGTLNTLRAAAPFLQEAAPAAVGVVSSLSGLLPYRGGGVYAASKAALNALLACLRLELVHSRITLGWVCPGPVRTGLIVDGVPHRKLPALARWTVPVLAPEQVARALVRLLERGGGCKVIPWQAAWYVSVYRCYPRVAEWVLRTTGAGEV